MTILVHPIYKPIPPEFKGENTVVISTVAKSTQPWCQLSPFILGPCKLYDNYASKNMENAWQYSKVYPEHLTKEMKLKVAFGQAVFPSSGYWAWAKAGWMNPKAVRYPMGKGAKPLFSLWEGKQLGYIAARKKIYGPLYAEVVQKTEAFRQLRRQFRLHEHLVLLDYDAYDHLALGMDLTEVLNCPDKKMGHAFVLKMLLLNSEALAEMDLR